MIEPVIDAFTTAVSPLERAISAMINSAALPKVAFNNPPTPWPRCSASSSVARPIQPARGITAKQEQMNKAVSFPNCGQIRSTTATGTKTSSQLSEGFSNDFKLVIHQVTGTHYAGEHKKFLNRSLGTGSAVSCSRLWVLRRPKLKLHFRKPSESQRSRNRFRRRNAPKQPMQNTVVKRRAS